MSRSDLRTILARWGPALGWMALIFMLSARPKWEIPDFGSLDFLIKKSGHLAEYAVLGVLMARALRGSAALSRAHVVWAFLLTALYGVSDEYHQTFVPGRLGNWGDVAVDATGAAIGLGLLCWRTRRRLRLAQGESETSRR